MHPMIWSTFVVIVLSCAPNAHAWDYKGHRVVGSIADALLTRNARARVDEILGFDLRTAAPWADCVKSVRKMADGTFEYHEDPRHPEYEVPCTGFRTQSEQARMQDYVKRNWSQCVYPVSGPERGCHNTYHFDDVCESRDRFDRTYLGTNDHDLVAAITAAIAVLQEKDPAGPFSILDKKEALFLLAHFMGDLHQPLHVAAVYLDETGSRVDPDAQGGINPATDTVGGNSIYDGDQRLHARWDAIPEDLGEAATPALLTRAREIRASAAPLEQRPAEWATDTIQAGKQAFSGLRFARSEPLKWTVIFDDRQAYGMAEDQIKREQLAKGGARLAEVLNALWP